MFVFHCGNLSYSIGCYAMNRNCYSFDSIIFSFIVTAVSVTFKQFVLCIVVLFFIWGSPRSQPLRC